MGFFAPKPLVTVSIHHGPEVEAYETNRLADHIQEHLEREGFSVTFRMKEVSFMDGIKTNFSVSQGIFYKQVDSIVTMVVSAYLEDRLEDVFGIDNPENPLYHEVYAQEVTVQNARLDMIEREGAYNRYVQKE